VEKDYRNDLSGYFLLIAEIMKNFKFTRDTYNGIVALANMDYAREVYVCLKNISPDKFFELIEFSYSLPEGATINPNERIIKDGLLYIHIVTGDLNLSVEHYSKYNICSRMMRKDQGISVYSR